MTLEETIDEMTGGAPAPKTEFHVTDESSACWVLRRLAAIEAEKALVAGQAKRRVEELEADRNRLMSRFGAELENWAREEAERRRRRTVTTLFGTLAFRTVPARLEITDPQSAADVAITLGLVRPAAPDLMAYRKRAEEALATTGELLPGVGMSEAREAFAVRLPRVAGEGRERMTGEDRDEGGEVTEGG